MQTYQIDLLRKNGVRDCLLSILCAKDQSAITLAKSIFAFNRRRATRVVVRREDEVIFEAVKTVRRRGESTARAGATAGWAARTPVLVN